MEPGCLASAFSFLRVGRLLVFLWAPKGPCTGVKEDAYYFNDFPSLPAFLDASSRIDQVLALKAQVAPGSSKKASEIGGKLAPSRGKIGALSTKQKHFALNL